MYVISCWISTYYEYSGNINLEPLSILHKSQYVGFPIMNLLPTTVWTVNLFLPILMFISNFICLGLNSVSAFFLINIYHRKNSFVLVVFSLLYSFWKKEKIKVDFWEHHAVYVCKSLPPSTFECLNWSLWYLVCISWHLRPSSTYKSFPSACVSVCVYPYGW
jgi:hypothetical protein